MDAEEIRAVVQRLETTRTLEEEAAWDLLRPLGKEVVPYLCEAYPNFKKWQGRVSLVFHSIKYARDSDDAFLLGISATKDKASLVRYRACGLLAYSLRKDALPALQELLGHADKKTVEDAKAAIDAIRSQNHHYFVDRDHSGRIEWVVNGVGCGASPVKVGWWQAIKNAFTRFLK